MSQDFSAFALFTAGLAVFAPLASALESLPHAPTTNEGNPTIAPVKFEKVSIGSSYNIKWNSTQAPSGCDYVSIRLLSGCPDNCIQEGDLIARSVANFGNKTWPVLASLEPDVPVQSTHGIQIVCDDSGKYQYSPNFALVKSDSPAPPKNSTITTGGVVIAPITTSYTTAMTTTECAPIFGGSSDCNAFTSTLVVTTGATDSTTISSSISSETTPFTTTKTECAPMFGGSSACNVFTSTFPDTATTTSAPIVIPTTLTTTRTACESSSGGSSCTTWTSGSVSFSTPTTSVSPAPTTITTTATACVTKSGSSSCTTWTAASISAPSVTLPANLSAPVSSTTSSNGSSNATASFTGVSSSTLGSSTSSGAPLPTNGAERIAGAGAGLMLLAAVAAMAV